ncbi:hypothetical protein A9X03_09125 [Mycobacterium sp. E1715]|uniref:DUF732 domain-containing protein n=1 Tax=unclassified Mycobacterium TaxID=2642494 RepID=UPI0007FDAB00|nr:MULTISPECIES: DUF732 domain-containing protein [unclassified Mycobacterium]OBG61070.1 hypothetical protein A5703_23925 [Mycobacterium sp. E188]OBG69508.1 hypothetical protein A5701_04865 [Mycobacterium sp. E3305]OBH29683.1 hypothetical protein A9X03_09125 [Mycobacterium sp. E1715]OBH45948.1 hypothetical protein A5691_15040 [Mycobacterium sp. E183]
MNVGPGTRSTIAAAMLAAAALLSAAPAAADPSDDAFLGALADNGIVVNDPITMARSVCAGLDRNQKTSVVAMKVMKDTSLSARQAGFFVGLSVSAYCPQYKGQTDGSLDWLNPLPPLM